MDHLDPTLFRAAMARLASAVTLITTDGPAGRRGMAATAVTSITDDPPNILVCVNKSARSHALIRRNGVFCVNVLAPDQQAMLGSFADSAGEDPFDVPDRFATLTTGAPVLNDAVASMDCTLDQIIHIGTHSLYVGHVVGVRTGVASHGLVYFDRAFVSVGAA